MDLVSLNEAPAGSSNTLSSVDNLFLLPPPLCSSVIRACRICLSISSANCSSGVFSTTERKLEGFAVEVIVCLS